MHKYSKIHAVGKVEVEDLLKGPVVIEEKVDGSQFSFCGVQCRSKSQDTPDQMFNKGVESVQELATLLTDGWTYCGEYLRKPKQNTLKYSRVPEKHIIIFDIIKDSGEFLSRQEKEIEATRIGLEVVPLLFEGVVDSLEQLDNLLLIESILGGEKIEGVVIKNYDHGLIGKYVREGFHERNGTRQKVKGQSNEIIQAIVGTYKTEARWAKAVQHLNEEGKISGSPSDIGIIMKEIHLDLKSEFENEIKEALFKWAWPQIAKGVANGAPDWYQQELAKQQIERK